MNNDQDIRYVNRPITIGLFGTCGKSTWREPFIKKYTDLGISYFNPQVEQWDPIRAENEAKHLTTDDIILLPVTSESYGLGSLSEIGFSIIQTVKADDMRYFVLLADDKLSPELDNELVRNESLRARALVNAHMKEVKAPNIFIVKSLEEMLELSLKLYEIKTSYNKVK